MFAFREGFAFEFAFLIIGCHNLGRKEILADQPLRRTHSHKVTYRIKGFRFQLLLQVIEGER